MSRSTVPVTCVSLAALLFSACSGPEAGPGGPTPPPPAPTPPPPPPPSGRIEIGPLPPELRVRGGDKVQLTATVFDASGNPVPGAGITWEVLGRTIRVGSVSSQGLVSFRSDTILGVRDYTVRAVSGALEATVDIPSWDWTLTNTALLRGLSHPTLGAWLPSAFGGSARLEVSVHCGQAEVEDVWMVNLVLPVGFDFGNFSYRLDAAAPAGQQWHINADHDYIALPNSASAEQFIAAMMAAEFLNVTFLGDIFVSNFSWELGGTDVVSDRLRAACD